MANTTNLNLVKPIGTDHALISDINGNSDKIDAYAGKVNTGLDALRDGLGILADGNTHAAITSGEFVCVKNHQTLPEGVYKATANIAANGALSLSNLTADARGGLNTLNEQIGTLTNPQTVPITLTSNVTNGSIYVRRIGKIMFIDIAGIVTTEIPAWAELPLATFDTPVNLELNGSIINVRDISGNSCFAIAHNNHISFLNWTAIARSFNLNGSGVTFLH